MDDELSGACRDAEGEDVDDETVEAGCVACGERSDARGAGRCAMSTPSMSAAVAREALRHTTTTEFLGLLAYIEGFGLVIGSLGVAVVPPRELCLAVDDVLYGREPWDPARGIFSAYLRARVRACLERLVQLRALVQLAPAGPPTFDGARRAVAQLDEAQLGAPQLGALGPILNLAHDAGERMVVHRHDDVRVLAAAVVACNATRAKLHLIAHQADGDTAPFLLTRVALGSEGLAPIGADDPGLSHELLGRPETMRGAGR